VDDELWKKSARHSPCHSRCFCSFAWICPLACCGIHPQHSESTCLILVFESVIRNRTCRLTEKKSCYTLTLSIERYDSTGLRGRSFLCDHCANKIYHAQSMYELRNGPQPSYAQRDGTEPEFERRREWRCRGSKRD
jgi:hypothetical protein